MCNLQDSHYWPLLLHTTALTRFCDFSIPRHQKATADMYTVKHPRWWVQSYLAGVPTMVLGGRDQGGNLIKVRVVGHTAALLLRPLSGVCF